MKGYLKFPYVLNILLLVAGSACVVSTVKLYGAERRLEVLGPAGFPLIVSALGIFLVAIITVFELVKLHEIHGYKIDIRDVRVIRTLLIIILTSLYIAAVGKLGFFVASIIYQSVLTIALGATTKVNMFVALIASILSVSSIYAVYTLLFRLPLPGAF